MQFTNCLFILLYCSFLPYLLRVGALSVTLPPNAAADTNTRPAPLYITIGPPCCGKTEALRSHLLSVGYNPDIVFSRDVALDEASSAYYRIPLAAFLFPSSHLDKSIATQRLHDSFECTVQDRLLDSKFERTDDELRSVILRLAGRMTPAEFHERCITLALQAGDTRRFFKKRRRQIANELANAVEEVVVQAVGEVICGMQIQQHLHEHDEELPYDDVNEQVDDKDADTNDDTTNVTDNFNATQAHLLSARLLIRTPHVDLFVPQAIFEGGIDSAQDALVALLKSTPPQEPVSWGNTNTRPSEYTAALHAAQEANRPVKFIAWGTSLLPRTSRKELLRRNVARFRSSGKYIPAGAIGAALGRVESLMNAAQKRANEMFGEQIDCPQDGNSETLEDWQDYVTNVGLADLAGFRMDEDGFVVHVGDPKKLGSLKDRSKVASVASSGTSR